MNKWFKHRRESDYDLSLVPFFNNYIIVLISDSSNSILNNKTSVKKFNEEILVSIVFLNSFSAIPIA